MWTPSDLHAVRTRRLPHVLILSLCLALPALAAAAQPPAGTAGPASSGALSAAERRQLRQQLERRYEPLVILNGVLLKARQERLGVRTVEVSGDSIVVNGARVGPEVLRSWLGDADAEPVLRLLALSPAERQEVFGLKRTVSAAAAPSARPSAAVPPASRPPAASLPPFGAASPPPSARPENGEGAEDEAAGRRHKPEARADEGEAPLPPAAPLAPVPPEAPRPTEEAPTPPTPPAPPTAPTPPSVSTGSRVRLGGPVTIERNEVADDVAVFGGPIHVYGEVSHDVVAIGGSVRIDGRVGGDVHSIGGGVHLGPHAEVMGDVTAVGGSIVREPGARVHGSVSEAGGAFPGIGSSGGEPRWFRHWPFFMFFPVGFSVAGRAGMLAIVLLLALLAMVVARRPFERVDFELATQFWKSLLAGFLAQLLFLPLLVVVSLVLIISIVGCLLILLYPVLLVLLVLASLVGFAAACYRTGRWLESRFEWQRASPWMALLVGFVAIEVWSLIASIFSGMHVFFIAAVFHVFGLAVRYVAWTAGFGAAILAYSRYRARRRAGEWGSGEIPRQSPPVAAPPPQQLATPPAAPPPAAPPAPTSEPPPEPAKP